VMSPLSFTFSTTNVFGTLSSYSSPNSHTARQQSIFVSSSKHQI
jgi:hypothetical protein